MAAKIKQTGVPQEGFPRPQDLGYGKGVACLFQKPDRSGYDVVYIDKELAEQYNREHMNRVARAGGRNPETSP